MVDAGSDIPMSFFEVMVGMAYALFADAPVDVAVIEVGMGGTWDATNVADARVAVVTPVALDHAEYLGPDVATIAGEKAGIIKADSIAVLAHQQPGALDTLVRRAVEVEAVVAREGTEFGVLERRVAVGGQQVRLQGLGGEYEEVFLPLFGAHQAQNAVTALAAVEAFLGAGAATGPIEQETVRAAFAAVRSPGRLERVRTSPTVLVDAAHNPAGMAATVDAIKESFDFTRLIGVVGCVSGKDVAGMLAALEDVCAELVVTQNSSPRAMPADELGALAVDVFGADRVSVSPAAGRGDRGGDRAGRGRAGRRPRRLRRAGHRQRDHRGRGPHAAGRTAGMTAPDPVRAGRALGGAAAGDPRARGHRRRCSCRAGIAQTGEGLTGGRLTYLLVLAVVLILAAGVQRRPQGVVIGTVLQVPLLLTGLFNSVMWFVAGAFVLIWLYLLQVRKELLGSPFRPTGASAP